MATNTSSREPRDSSSGSNSGNGDNGSSNGRVRTPKTFKQTAASAMSTETIMELIHRLGVVDMAVDRLRGRAEEIDFDELFDKAGRYVRRNPGVIVVGFGVLTLAAAAVVWLENHSDSDDVDFDDDDADVPQVQTRPRPARAGASIGRGPGS